MAVKTLHLRKIDELAGNIYFATNVVGRRAKQIIQERKIKEELETKDLDPGLMDEFVETITDYEEKTKPVTQALDELLNSDLKWNKPTTVLSNE